MVQVWNFNPAACQAIFSRKLGRIGYMYGGNAVSLSKDCKYVNQLPKFPSSFCCLVGYRLPAAANGKALTLLHLKRE